MEQTRQSPPNAVVREPAVEVALPTLSVRHWTMIQIRLPELAQPVELARQEGLVAEQDVVVPAVGVRVAAPVVVVRQAPLGRLSLQVARQAPRRPSRHSRLVPRQAAAAAAAAVPRQTRLVVVAELASAFRLS
jgi:hypothetical protein